MIAVVLPGAFGFLAFCLWIWAVLDCIATDSIIVRNLPKTTWLLLVLFIPTVGGVAWLLLGRPEGAGMSLGGNYRPPNSRTQAAPRERRPLGPDDDADWRPRTTPSRPAKPATDAAEQRRLQERAADLDRREAEIEKRERAQDDDVSG